MMIIENQFNLGDIVFLKTDRDQHERIVTKITVAPHGLMYQLCYGSSDSWHWEIEISKEKDV